MPNTVIQLKKSATPTSAPADLANGELAINFADGKLFYKNTAGFIAEFSGAVNSFGTVNANGTLVVSDTSGDILTLLAGNNITIVGDAVNDRVTIGLSNDVVVPGTFKIGTVGGDEGGEIVLGNAITNSVLAGDVKIDVYQNRLRFFESGSPNRGAFIDLSIAGSGVGSNLLATGGGTTDTTARATAEAAFAKANAALPNTNGATFAGSLTVSTNLTADKIISTNNGQGENFKVGDDAWIGDFNISNAIRIKGQQDPSQAYINFGTSDGTLLGRSGSGNLTYGGNTVWHAGVDGAGSGLDADLLDGQQGSFYAAAATLSGANTAVGAGANAFASSTIAGANTAVGTGANTYLLTTLAGANTAVGTGANSFSSATIAGANTAVGTGANSFSSATIAGANTAVGTGANAFATAAAAGANAFMTAVQNGSNTAIGAGANAFTSATIAGANTAVGTGANTYLLTTLAGANTAVGAGANAFATAAAAGANAFMIAVQNGSNTAVGTGANAFASATIAGANTAVGAGANTYANGTFVRLTAGSQTITGDLSIVGNLSFSGNTSFSNVQTLSVTDPLIFLASNNTSDIVDIGFIGLYSNGTANVHTGLYREHVDKMYYLFQGYDREPVNNHIGALSNNMTLAVLNADIRTSNLSLAGANLLLTLAGSNTAVGTGANTVGSAAFARANAALANTTGTFNGTLTVAGNFSTTGNVGIGAAPTGNRLLVQKTAGESVLGEAYLTDGTYWTQINSRSPAGAYNPLVQAGDHTIIYSDGTSNTGAFFIGQWSSFNRGIRITATGNVGIGTASPNTVLDVRGTVQGRSYSIPDTGASIQWVRIGRFTAPQTGCTIKIRAYIHGGYNAVNSQDFYLDLYFKTSNGSTLDGNGFAGNSWYYTHGFSAHNPTPKWVGNAAGISATSYELFLNLPVFTNDSHYIAEIVDDSAVIWTDLGNTGQADPGSSSNTVCVSTAGFNVPLGNVGIGTVSPGERLHANSGSSEFAVQWDSNGSKSWVLGSATNRAYIRNKTDSVEALTILNAGNVGIGTNNPSTRLHVLRSDFQTGYSEVATIVQQVNASNTSILAFGQVVNNRSFIEARNENNVKGSLLLQPYGGRVGVATTSPSNNLSVTGGATVISAATITTAANAKQLQIGESTDNADYRLNLGYYLDGGTSWKSSIQSLENNVGGALLLNPLGGDVGIGTTSPLGTSGYRWMTINGPTSGAITSYSVNNTEYYRIQAETSAVYLNAIQNIQMVFLTNNIERMRITNEGRVGINNNNPSSNLHVVGTANITSTLSVQGADIMTTLAGANTAVGTGANTVGSAAFIQANAAVINANLDSVNATRYVVFDDAITGQFTRANVSHGLTYNPSTNTITSNTIVVTGNIAIGRTTSGFSLDVVGTINASNVLINGAPISAGGGGGGGATILTDTVNATRYVTFANNTTGTFSQANVASSLTFNPSTGTLSATIFNSTSDINSKQNIKTIENGLNIINSLRGVSFDWKDTGKPSYGLIAQEVEKHVPALVDTDENGKKSLNYDAVIGFLVEAIKELSKDKNV